MAHMKDMEELLHTVGDSQIRDYMREAMSCYMAGAYRGCIVLSYIALFDDLLAKLGEFGKVNAVAKSVHDEATKKKQDQEVFESFLLDQLSAKALIPALDAAFLNVLRILRNKSAHPSGHTPSAEEARFIFAEAIQRVLSKPILSTTQLVEGILVRLSNSNFFPTTQIEDIAGTVASESSALHEAAIPMLVARLVILSNSPDATIAKNAKFFLIGLARHPKEIAAAEIRTKLIEAKADDTNYSELILQVVSSNGKTAADLSGTSLLRLKQVLATAISNLDGALPESKLAHPVSAIQALAGILSESNLDARFGTELQALIDKRPYSAGVIGLAADRPLLLSRLHKVMLVRAGSATFTEANGFAKSIGLVEAALGPQLTGAQAFELLGAVVRAADWGAWDSKALEISKFAAVPTLRSKAIAFATAHPDAAKAKLGELHVGSDVAIFVSDHLTETAEQPDE